MRQAEGHRPHSEGVIHLVPGPRFEDSEHLWAKALLQSVGTERSGRHRDERIRGATNRPELAHGR